MQQVNLFNKAYCDFLENSELAHDLRAKLLSNSAYQEIISNLQNDTLQNSGGFTNCIVKFWGNHANNYGLEAANRKLEEFIATGMMFGYACTAIYGISVKEPTSLGDGEMLYPKKFLKDYQLFDDMFQYTLMGGEDSCFLVTELQFSPENEEPEVFTKLKEKHRAIVLALCCLEGYKAIQGRQALVCNKNFPPGIFLNSSGSSNLRIPFSVGLLASSFTSVDTRFSEAVKKLIRPLDGQGGDSLLKALNWMSRAKDEIDPVDRALFLGIALEMVLLSDIHGNAEKPDQLRLSFCLRGSKLIGGSSDEKKENYAILKEVYSLRSQAAHSGRFSTKRVTFERKYFHVAELIFRKIVLDDKPDSWDELLLS